MQILTLLIVAVLFNFILVNASTTTGYKNSDVLVKEIESMVMGSRLLNHDFLTTFAHGKFNDMMAATKIFVQNHYAYSRNFPKYLNSIVTKLNIVAPEDAPILYENQEEEKGKYSDEQLANLANHGIPADWVNNIPHPLVMRAFVDRVGLTEAEINDPNTIGAVFTRNILKLYDESNACEALAIIAFGIERTVPFLYQHIWDGFKTQDVLTPKDYIFFPLHVLIDDGHADHLAEAFVRLNDKDPKMCSTAKKAVESVLTMRSKMYDDMKALIEGKTQTLLDKDVKQASKIAGALKHPELTLTENMAVASHILADEGHGGTMSGQFTCRDGVDEEGGVAMWTTPYGFSFEEMRPESFIKVNHEMETMVGEGGPNMAVRFHLHLYKVRPDVQCIIHTHPVYTSALAQMGVPLHIAHMDVMAFYEDVQYLPRWPGIPFGDEEGLLLEGLLGQEYNSALLAHHGLIVMGRTLEETVYRAYFFEKAARLQLLMMGGRPPVALPAAETTNSNMTCGNSVSNSDGVAGEGALAHLPKTVPALSQQARDWRISDPPVKAHYYSWARVAARKNNLDFVHF